jgi:hypothetical protein
VIFRICDDLVLAQDHGLFETFILFSVIFQIDLPERGPDGLELLVNDLGVFMINLLSQESRLQTILENLPVALLTTR